MMEQKTTTTYSNDTNHFVNSNNTVRGDFHAEGMVVNQGVVTKFLVDQEATWEDVTSELKLITQNLPGDSKEKLLSEKILRAAQEKDEKTICALVENNSETFFSAVFKNTTGAVVGGLVTQLITHILGVI